MRHNLLLLFCLFSLTACVNYFGTHPHSQPQTLSSLSVHHHYPTPSRIITTQGNWWEKFHDPQLNQLINIALKDSPDIQLAESRIRQAQAIADAAVAPLAPSINFDGTAGREHFTANGYIPPPIGGSTQNFANVALNFKYELDFWGKNRQELATRVSEARAAEADLTAARLIISTAVASQYLTLQSNVAQLAIAEALLKQRKALQKIIVARNQHQLSSNIPRNTGDIDIENIKLKIAQTKEAVQISQHQLAVLMGKNPFTTEINLRKFHYNPALVNLPTFIPANLLARRPDILASRWRTEAAAHQINVAKARFFPNINLSGFLSYQTILGFNLLFKSNSRDNNIEGAVDLPIFDMGLRRANLNTRYAEYDVAVNQYNQSILNALREVADQVTISKSIQSQQLAQAQVLHNIQRNYRILQIQFRHGLIDDYNVLISQGTLLNQQQLEIQLQAQRLLNTIAMIKALGGDYAMTAKGCA